MRELVRRREFADEGVPDNFAPAGRSQNAMTVPPAAVMARLFADLSMIASVANA
ncbi:hypothetical protein WHT83_15750 [Aminobacter sp. P9b]|uniref:Uncharacterized protein n=1 Tax=Aminobacter niigataensis TaxID=83265 RepID=A0ABR6KYE7_9HYPH|nr:MULTISPECIES: hypothetical protein [Aminobacter]MBB4649446.1 hypothetical protein [Aminobacter niigataensis]